MKGKNKFTEIELENLRKLVQQFGKTNDAYSRKKLRAKMRKFGFYVSDFGIQNITSSIFENLHKKGFIKSTKKSSKALNPQNKEIEVLKSTPSKAELLQLEKKLIHSNFISPRNLENIQSLDTTGFYCIKLKNNSQLPYRYQQHLSKKQHNIIYIGKAENATLRKRFLGQELRAKGHGTFFRSIGAVLEYVPEPSSLKNRKNKNNYKFSLQNEKQIIQWINQNLEVNWVSYDQDFSIEEVFILKYMPLLNYTHNPLKLSELIEDKARCRAIAKN